MSIPVPDYRNYNSGGISIEFLYTDEDLKRQDENGRRLYVTSEFNENGRFTSDVRIGVKNNHDVKNYILPEKEKIQVGLYEANACQRVLGRRPDSRGPVPRSGPKVQGLS